MKVTDPIDVFLADKLFQLTTSYVPEGHSPDEYRASARGQGRWSSWAAATASARTSPRWPASTAPPSRPSAGRAPTPTSSGAPTWSPSPSRCSSSTAASTTSSTPPAMLPRGSLVETSEETIYAATEVNYLAPVFIAQVFFPHLQRTGGSLLLFTSSSYTRGRSGYSLYSSAKAAVVNLTQALADEWGESGVRVNCINPERTGTPMRTKAFGEEPAGLAAGVDVGGAGLDRHAALRRHRPHRRPPQARPAGRPGRRRRPGLNPPLPVVRLRVRYG